MMTAEPTTEPSFAFVTRTEARFECLLPVPAARVWAALSDRTELGRWFFPANRNGGRYAAHEDRPPLAGATAEEAPLWIEFGSEMRFDLAGEGDRCRVRFTLRRPEIGWHPGLLASYHGTLVALADLVEGRDEGKRTSRSRRDFATYERAVSAAFVDGKPIVRSVYFGSGSVELRNDARDTLDDFVGLLAANSRLRVIVDGHADDDLGRSESLELARLRAAVVAAELHRRGIAKVRVTVRSLGGADRQDARRDDRAIAKNRRVELIPSY